MSSSNGSNLYEYPNGVLRNKFALRESEELARTEATLTALRIAELIEHPLPAPLDLDHLKALHRYIFQDIYDWAGELRQVDIFKGSSRFAHFAFLEDNARLLFNRLAQEHFLQGMTREEFAARAAYCLGELNALHPFREGHGRTQRLFLSALAQAAGYRLRWDTVDATCMVEASVLSLFRADNSEIERILLDIIVPL